MGAFAFLVKGLMKEADLILSDLRNFLWLVWKHLHLPDPTPIQYDIASYLQHGPKRMVVEGLRGIGKSWVTSAFVCWLLLCDPQLNILVASASKERADSFSTFTLRLINEMEILQHLRPREGQRNSKISFDVGPARASHSPSVKSVGIFGQITGSRADVVIADDLEIPSNSMTQGMRDKLAEAVKEFDAVLKTGDETRIIYLGTPQTEMSLYNRLPERGYSIRLWPARFPKAKLRETYGDRLAPMLSERLAANPCLSEGHRDYGMPTDTRFTDEDLIEREMSYGRSGFALQFMLDTSLSDADRYPLRASDLVVMNLDHTTGPEKVVWAASPELCINDLPCVGFNGDHYYRPMAITGEDGKAKWLPYTGSVMSIDPSGRGTDETAYAVVKMLNGQLFALESGGISGGYSPETLQALSVIAARQKVNHIIVESNFGDGMFTELLKPVLHKIHPCFIEEVRHNTQKEKRIVDTLEPVMNQHRLIFDQKVILKDYASTQHLPTDQQAKYQLFYQMTRITKDRGALAHDDRLDALAIAVAFWVEQMGQDVDKKTKERADADFQKELEKFMQHTVGYKPPSRRWIARK